VVFDFGGSDFSDVAGLVAVAWVLLVICGFYVGSGGWWAVRHWWFIWVSLAFFGFVHGGGGGKWLQWQW